MNFDNNYKMEKALAEILGINLDIVDMLGLTIEPDIGNDDCLYGYYVEFPKKESIDKYILSQIEQIDTNKIPWGETKNYSEAEFSNTSVDPFGYQAEWKQEKYEIEHSPSKEQVIQRLEDIKKNIVKLSYEENIDELKIKVLIFVSYSITEGFVKKFVLDAIPIEKKTINNQKFLEKLYSANGRKTLYKRYTNKELDYIPYYREIRNPLSHDILSGYISHNKLFFDDINQSFDINQIIESLITYIQNITEKK